MIINWSWSGASSIPRAWDVGYGNGHDHIIVIPWQLDAQENNGRSMLTLFDSQKASDLPYSYFRSVLNKGRSRLALFEGKFFPNFLKHLTLVYFCLFLTPIFIFWWLVLLGLRGSRSWVLKSTYDSSFRRSTPDYWRLEPQRGKETVFSLVL